MVFVCITVCPGSSDPFYTGNYYIKWVTTSWTYSKCIAWPSPNPRCSWCSKPSPKHSFVFHNCSFKHGSGSGWVYPDPTFEIKSGSDPTSEENPDLDPTWFLPNKIARLLFSFDMVPWRKKTSLRKENDVEPKLFFLKLAGILFMFYIWY